MQENRHSISVVIPVFNSENSLSLLVERLYAVLPEISSSFELILVNDGSLDNSWSVIKILADQFDWISGIDLRRNYGQHNALLCGIRTARYEVIITMDDDLQYPPEEIRALLNQLDKGYEVVYGEPIHLKNGIWRSFASRLIRIALRIAMRSRIAGKASAFRAFRTPVREAFSNYQSPFVSIDVLLSWGTFRFSSIQVRQDARHIGVSNYSLTKLFGHAIDMLTGFSDIPLRMASMAGFILTVFGILVLFYVIGRYIWLGGSVPGFPFLASLISIFSGTQLFALGIIGEYLARIHRRTMERPAYVIRSRVQSLTQHPDVV